MVKMRTQQLPKTGYMLEGTRRALVTLQAVRLLLIDSWPLKYDKWSQLEPLINEKQGTKNLGVRGMK